MRNKARIVDICSQINQFVRTLRTNCITSKRVRVSIVKENKYSSSVYKLSTVNESSYFLHIEIDRSSWFDDYDGNKNRKIFYLERDRTFCIRRVTYETMRNLRHWGIRLVVSRHTRIRLGIIDYRFSKIISTNHYYCCWHWVSDSKANVHTRTTFFN